MTDFASDAKEGMFLFNEAAAEIKATMNGTAEPVTSQWHDPNYKSPLKSSVGDIKKDYDNAKKAIKKAKSSAKNFLNSINPKNGLGAVKALAQFLLCPEESFLADVMNAFNMVVNGVKNIKPKELLGQALGELTNHLLHRFPAVNNLLNFMLYMRRYFNTTKLSGVDNSKELVDKLIKELGDKWNFNDDYDGFDLLRDILNPDSDRGKIPIGGNDLKVEQLSNKCSALS